MTPTPSFHDVEKLSAYLDGQLKPSEMTLLEARLQSDPELASVLKDLREARGILRQLPQRRAPRSFTLTPRMVGQKPPLPRSYPVFRFATVLATLLLFFTFATNFMAPRLVRTAAPYPYGVGGGEGGEPELAMEAAPEELAEPAEPAIEEPAAPAAPAAPEMPAPAATEGVIIADDTARIEPTVQVSEKIGVQEAPPAETFAQAVPPQAAPPAQPAPPVGGTLQIVLAGIAVLSALIAFILRYNAIRKWRAKAR